MTITNPWRVSTSRILEDSWVQPVYGTFSSNHSRLITPINQNTLLLSQYFIRINIYSEVQHKQSEVVTPLDLQIGEKLMQRTLSKFSFTNLFIYIYLF